MGRQGPRSRQVPSLTPSDTFHLDGCHVSMGRQGPKSCQVPSLTPGDTLRPDDH